MLKVCAATALAMLCLCPVAHAQTCLGRALTGSVRDSGSALIPGAVVTLDDHERRISAADGSFNFPCVDQGKHTLTASYDGFAAGSIAVNAPHAAALIFKLTPSTQDSITVNADTDSQQVPAPGGGNGLIVAGKQLQNLADDPDDLLRELQQLAAGSGGSPGSTIISVDGFQDSAQLPPKDSIAYINVSPDLFSAEYREPPFGGARVEIYTKPGARDFHGALFATNSSSWMNARDAFTTTLGSIAKQRYGFDLSGPIRRKGSNFALNLEHRSIDETVGVDATIPDANGNGVIFNTTVPQPQRLWEGNARVDWQLGPDNIFFISYSANFNHLQNQGVGGQILPIAGFDSSSQDQTIRSSDITTISPRLLHEARVSFESQQAPFIPASTAPSVSVAGYFTGGGATGGNSRKHFTRVEYDDDFILNTRSHLIKSGFQLLFIRRNSQLPTGFNGTYIFSGVAGATPATSLTALQQYEQAVNNGGTAYEFSNVAGDPNVKTAQVRFAAFFQDNIKLSPRWSAFYGVRYALESDPGVYNGLVPRGGFSFTPDKKQTWVLKAHFGIFNGQYVSDDAEELHREDGNYRITSLVYNPVYGNPFQGATPIHAERTQSPTLGLPVYVFGEFNVSKDLPFGFNINAESVFLRFLTHARTLNINQPLGPNPSPSPYGPRPLTSNLNILQTRNDGTGQGHGEFFSLSNFKRKRMQFFVGALHLNIRSNSDDNTFAGPQSAYTDAGEDVRRAGDSLWQIFGQTTIALPCKLSLSGNGNANGGEPFNILTGSDNNGDGNFNDRPQYAPAGSVANGRTIFQTPFGLVTNTGPIVNGIPLAPIPRNLGALPWTFHLDANLQRAFLLTRDAKAAHQQTLTANIRSANFLNHSNVTAEGNIPGTPQFLVPVAVDTSRRIEFGLRYSF